MVEETNARSDDIEDRRQERGTWPWFVLNVILFPAPAHFTLLRIKDFRFGKSIIHLGVTFLLFFVLLISASLQLVLPDLGRLWMLLPVLSGLLALYANRSLRGNFKPFDITTVTRTHVFFFLFLVLIFAVLSILPSLDLIELNQKSTEVYKSWIRELPYWQDLLILVSGLFLLLVGYITNSIAPVTINRAFILYACLIIFISMLTIILLLVFAWLKIQGGFGTQLVIVLLAAILATDYWDARSFGQYTRRFFFLTCTKVFYFVFLWICFLGLPQKAASTLSAYYFNKSRPAVIQGFNKYLVFSDRDRFKSAHVAARRMRSLYSGALCNSRQDELNLITGLLHGNKRSIFPADADICRLADLINRGEIQPSSMIFDRVPIFRPIHPDWDVMLTALLIQGTISKTDLNNFIADFKTMLPKTSQGWLPNISTPYKARYVSLATNTHVDFVPPRFEFLEDLLEKNICPVLSLRLAGVNYWATLLHIDYQSGIAWFRIKTLSCMGKSIQILFDSDESRNLKDEILSRFMVPLPLEYLRDVLEHFSGAVVVFTPTGLEKALPDLFVEKDLAEMNRAVAFASDPVMSTAPIFVDPQTNLFSEYAGYTRAVALIKAMLRPTPYKGNLFIRPAVTSFNRKGLSRIKEIETLLGQIGTLRDCDRIDIAHLLVKNNHVNGAPDLFVRLATEKIVASDLIDCSGAFRIGRELFLLGYHEKAFRYLELAFLRHPFNSEYELWYHIAREKLKKSPVPFYSPPEHQPDLYLYYQTLADIRKGHDKSALNRLENALEKDSHDSLATHLLSKYFSRPLDERHFFPAQEGL
jgi:tetratricopeptide (TPR) repeat protein